jgi:outer membrane usher protein
MSTQLRESLYSVRVNGDVVSQGSIFLTDGRGRLYARQSELSQWRFPTPASNKVILFNGISYIPLATYAGLVSHIDAGTQEVEITVPVEIFAATVLQLQQPEPLPLTAAQSGYFLNYDFHAAAGAASPSFVNGLFDLGVSERSGASLSSNAFVDTFSRSGRVVRLDTTWQINDPGKHQSTYIGDDVTQPRALGIPVRFAGLSFGTDFSTDPQFITFPTPSIDGLATLPSTVDVFLNNYQASSNPVPAGPFDIGSIPALNGANQAQMVVRDITGAEHVVTLNFYESPSLLKPGLSDYTVQAGAERLNYGLSSASYGPSLFAGTLRQGISDNLTAEGHMETMGSLRDEGLNLTTLLNDSGTLSAGLQQSSSPQGGGRMAQIGFEYRGSAFNAYAQAQAANQSFWELGDSASSARLKQLVQGGLSFSVGSSQLSLTDVERKDWDGTAQHVSLVSLTHGLRHGSVSISYAPPIFGRPATIAANLITSFAQGDSAVATTGLQGGRATQGIAVQSALPADGSGTAVSVQEQSADTKSYVVQVTRQTQAADASVGMSSVDDRTSVSADLNGALVQIGGKLREARQITGSYGLISVPGYPGVGVLLNNRIIGETDKNGDLVVNDLDAYNRNQIAIDPASLPISANIASATLAVVPSKGGAVAVRFVTQNAGGIRIRIVDSAGAPLPPGSTIEGAGSVVWPVAEDGAVYLAGINPGSQILTALRGANQCRFTVVVPVSVADLPDLGTFTCKEPTTSTASSPNGR